MAACPNCHETIPLMRVRSRFECPSCSTFLASNSSWVLLLGLLSWAAVGSISATSICEGAQTFWCFSLFDTIFGGGVAFVIAVLFLRVKRGR